MHRPVSNQPAAPSPLLPPRLMALRLPVDNRPATVLIPILLIFYSFLLLPPEAEFQIFSVRLNGYRLAAVLMSIPALWMTIRNARGISLIDIAVVAMSFWTVLSFIMVYGFEFGLVRGLGLVIDVGLSYFVARACIKSPDDLRRFLILCLPGVMFAGTLLFVESLSGHLLFRPFAASIFGDMTAYVAGEERGATVFKEELRLGMLRAYGPFDHPILAGTIMIGLLPLYYFSGLRGWPYLLGILFALTGIFSMSSAAFLALIIVIIAIAIHYILPYFAKISWWLVVAGAILLGFLAHIVSKNGIILVLARVTLTPDTAWYRMAIWKYGSQNIAKNPWFGLGYGQWERAKWMVGDSVDAHFLLLAMRHGLVVPILLLFAMIYGAIRLGQVMNYVEPKDRHLMLGVNIAIIIFLIVGQTVNFFGSGVVVLMFMVALLASMVTWAEQRVTVQRELITMQMRQMLDAAQPAAAPAAS